jgi:hypothetical protein
MVSLVDKCESTGNVASNVPAVPLLMMMMMMMYVCGTLMEPLMARKTKVL